jgi:soluble lytic murein transglycosylase-like protein
MSILNWKNKVLGYTAQMGGGGSSGGGGGQTTQQADQYSNISTWAQPYVSSLLGAGQQQIFNTRAVSGTAGVPAKYDEDGNLLPGTGIAGTPGGTEITGMKPYMAYGYNGAGMSAADQAAANAAVAGFNPLQNQAFQGASDLSQSQMPGVTANAAYGSFNAGQNLANQSTNPSAVGAYMNPYIQNTLNPALQLLNQQYGIAGQQQQGQATQAGAFGGSREALMSSLNSQNQMLAQNQLVGNAYNQAFNNAQNQMNQVANIGLQGYGQAGSLAGQQLGQQQGILGLQNQFGGQQQQQAQNIINAGMTNYQTGQNYGLNQLQKLSSLASPYITKDVTTTQQQAQPSATSQLIGLGTAGLAGAALANKAAQGGLMKSYAAGGSVKGYAPGGIASLNRKALLNPTSISSKQLQDSTKDGVIAPQVSGIAQAIQLNEKVHGDAAANSAKGMPQGTIMDELRAQAAQKDEQEAMAEAIPKAIEVLKHKMEVALQAGDTESVQRYAQELQQLVAMVQQPQQQQGQPSAPAPAGIEQLAAAGGQPPEQGIEAAPSNLPTQTMAEGGIIGYARGGSAKVLADADEEDRLAAEEAEIYPMYGSGSENDFVQSIMPAAKQSGTAQPSAAVSVNFEPKEKSSEFTATRKGSHKYESEIISEAKKIGLPEQIAIHAAFKETGNLKNPETARSRAGAIGVMQLMPGTAKELGVDPYNPEENIRGGVTYLKKLYDKYQDPHLTLMAYNAGPGRLDRALRSEKGIASLPQETLAYRMAAGGAIKGYSGEDDESLVAEDPAAVRRAYIDAAQMEAGIKSPYRSSQADVREAENRIAYLNNRPNRADQASVREAEQRIMDAVRPNRADQAEVRASDNRMLASNVQPTPVPTPVPAPAKPFDTEERDRERARAIATANANRSTAPAVPTVAQQNQGITNLPQTAKQLSPLEELQQEIVQDYRARKASAKDTRETNNLLAIMQGGFGMAASKNIHPLGAAGEGGQQAIGTLAALRKQESDEAKDIGAQQLGLYRFGATAEAAKAQREDLQKYREASLGLRPDKEDVEMQKIEKALSSNPQLRDLRERMQLEAKNGTLTAELETKYQNAITKITQSIYKNFGRDYKPVDIGAITPPPPPKDPSLWDRITGKGSNTTQGTPPPPAGYQVQ